MILKAFAGSAFDFGGWPGPWNVPVLLIFYILVLGTNIEHKDKFNILCLCIVQVLMLAGFFVVYLLSPYDLGWHLRTSLNRLLCQLWPSNLFIFFLIARTSEKALGLSRTSASHVEHASTILIGEQRASWR